LLGQKSLKPILEQARNYATDLGAQFALATNGSQIILFKPYLPGKSWTSGIALVWHDHADIKEDFAYFHSLLSRDQVLSGSLTEAFEAEEGVTTQLYSPIDYVQNPDRELVRNHFWRKLSSVLGPLLSDRSEETVAQEEVIRNCYVTTPLSDQADNSLDALVKDALPIYLLDAGVVDVLPSGRNPFSRTFIGDIERSRPGTYILTGGVGSGKTTFLRRFVVGANRSFVEHYCVWLHIDFLSVGNVDPGDVDKEIRAFAFSAIRRQLESSYPSYVPSTGEDVKLLFSDELKKAALTKLYGLNEGEEQWARKVAEILDGLFYDDEKFSFAILKRLRIRGLRIVIVLDNTDQLGEAFQERIFLFAQRLSSEYQVLCIVSLREEKFFAAYRRGIFDAYGDHRFHIGSPDLGQVIYRRLDYGRKKFTEVAAAGGSLPLEPGDIESIDRLLKILIQSTTKQNSNIVRMLACVSNGDMRHALDMFRDFISSGNTNIEKILAVGSGYVVPFHEFAKSAILGSRKYYQSSVSRIINLFVRSESRGASHLAACRVLARLSAAQGVASTHGEGFISTQKLLREYRESFGVADDFLTWGSELLRRGLIESEPPRQGDLRETDALRITAAGAYYWRYLVRSFAYLDLVFVDTPLSDRTVARRLADLGESNEIKGRLERVRIFLKFLEDSERAELTESSRRSGPYVDSLMQEVRIQIENEIKVIRKRLG
jgi:hypothetical protein